MNTKFGTPLSGGNFFEKEIEFKAIENNDISMLEMFGLDINSYLPNVWYLLNKIGIYFSNIFKLENSDIKLIYKIQQVIYLASLNGVAGLKKVGDKFIPIVLNNLKFDEYDELISYDYTTYQSWINHKCKDNVKYISNCKDVNDMVVLYWGTVNNMNFVTNYNLCNSLMLILENIIFKIIIQNKQILYKANDVKSAYAELKTILNPHNPFIIRKGFLNDIENKFQLMDNPVSLDILEFYNRYAKIVNSIIGIKDNQSQKSEENKEVEILYSNFENDVYDNQFFICIKMFLEELRSKFNVDVKIKDTMILDDIKEINEKEPKDGI